MTSIDKRIGALSDPGKERSENQDAMLCASLPYGQLLAVADGMGGHLGGATASRLALDTIHSYAKDFTPDPANPDSYKEMLWYALVQANHEVFTRSQQSPELRGMGTTLVAALIVGSDVYIAHVGDSRLYFFNPLPGRVTRDHTMVQEMVDHNIISPEQAKNHPEAHKLLRAIGHKPEVEPEVQPHPIRLGPGDAILLCSDGLYDVVTDDEIGDIVLMNSPQEATEALVRLANERGGPDNITVIIYKMPGGKTRRFVTSLTRARGRRRTGFPLAAWAAILAGCVAVALTVLLFVGPPIFQKEAPRVNVRTVQQPARPAPLPHQERLPGTKQPPKDLPRTAEKTSRSVEVKPAGDLKTASGPPKTQAQPQSEDHSPNSSPAATSAPTFPGPQGSVKMELEIPQPRTHRRAHAEEGNARDAEHAALAPKATERANNDKQTKKESERRKKTSSKAVGATETPSPQAKPDKGATPPMTERAPRPREGEQEKHGNKPERRKKTSGKPAAATATPTPEVNSDKGTTAIPAETAKPAEKGKQESNKKKRERDVGAGAQKQSITRQKEGTSTDTGTSPQIEDTNSEKQHDTSTEKEGTGTTGQKEGPSPEKQTTTPRKEGTGSSTSSGKETRGTNKKSTGTKKEGTSTDGEF